MFSYEGLKNFKNLRVGNQSCEVDNERWCDFETVMLGFFSAEVQAEALLWTCGVLFCAEHSGVWFHFHRFQDRQIPACPFSTNSTAPTQVTPTDMIMDDSGEEPWLQRCNVNRSGVLAPPPPRSFDCEGHRSEWTWICPVDPEWSAWEHVAWSPLPCPPPAHKLSGKEELQHQGSHSAEDSRKKVFKHLFLCLFV